MEAKIEKISELSKLLSVKTRMSDDLFHLFGKFGIGHLLSRLSLEKQDGVSASELILSLCLFRIVGESIHSICKHKIYDLSNHGKNCFYRMMIRPQMDWRRLMNHFALRYMCLLRKYSEAPQSNTTTCFIIDDTVLEKSGVRMEGISRVFDHVKGRCVLGYKLLLCAFFDGKTTIPFDFLMALTLWKRVLACIEHILRILGETLGVTTQHLMATISGNDKELSKILVMAEALEKWDEVCGQTI